MSQPETSAGAPANLVPPAPAGAPTPSQGLALVFLSLTLLLTVGLAVQGMAVYPGLLLTEVGLLLVPTLAACRRLGVPAGEGLGLRRPVGSRLGAALAQGGAMGAVGFAMAICLTVPAFIILLILGGRHPGVPLPLDTLAHYLLAVALGAVLAPLCEEILFRGFLLRSLRSHGLHAMVWVSAVAFGLFHMDPLRFIPTLALGVVFGYLTVASGSLYPAVAAHATNNFIALTLGYRAGAGSPGDEPLTYELLRRQILETLTAPQRAISSPDMAAFAARDPDLAVRLAISGAVAALLAAGVALAGLLGVWLWVLLRRRQETGTGTGGLEAVPGRRLLAVPWTWGLAGLGAAIWSLVLWSYWRP